MDIYKNIIDNLIKNKSKNKLSNSIWSSYFKAGKKCDKNCGKLLKIIILNAPCNGFGDLIFALKLFKYIKEWYNADVTLATTLEKGLLDLGADPKYTVGIIGHENMQCRRFKTLKFNKKIPKQDLILVAPVQMDFSFDLMDVKNLIPYANVFNTFSFSEYNDKLNKNFTFNTGVGNNRDGILLTTPVKNSRRPDGLKNPYILIYVAKTIDDVDTCILSFIEMVAIKYYKTHKNLDIVIPEWFADINLDNQIINKIFKYYPSIYVHGKTAEQRFFISDIIHENKITFRCDILPVSNDKMMNLMDKSLNDILLTGDQSITDCISCCYKKNIFYQIAPWKSNLALNLAKEMPSIYLKNIKTSCGSLKAISYHSSYENFRKKWDFRTRAKPKMDAIILSILAIKNNKKLSDIINKPLKNIKNYIEDNKPLKSPSKIKKYQSKTASRKRRSKTASRKRRSKTASRKRRSKTASRKRRSKTASRKRLSKTASRKRRSKTASRKRRSKTASRKRRSKTVSRKRRSKTVSRKRRSKTVSRKRRSKTVSRKRILKKKCSKSYQYRKENGRCVNKLCKEGLIRDKITKKCRVKK